MNAKGERRPDSSGTALGTSKRSFNHSNISETTQRSGAPASALDDAFALQFLRLILPDRGHYAEIKRARTVFADSIEELWDACPSSTAPPQ